MSSSGRFLAGAETITRPVFNSGPLVDNPQGYLLVLLTDFFLLPEALLVHGQHVSIFLDVGLTFLGVDDLVKKDLILRVNLNKIFLRTMVIGTSMTFIEEVHVPGIRQIDFRFFGNNVLNTIEVT